MRIQSNLKPRDYTEKEVCRIINPKQRDLYIKHRVFPIDMQPSVTDDGKEIIVYIFLIEETKEKINSNIDISDVADIFDINKIEVE